MVRENCKSIKCVVTNNSCVDIKYDTFSSLRRHVKVCKTKQIDFTVEDESSESVTERNNLASFVVSNIENDTKNDNDFEFDVFEYGEAGDAESNTNIDEFVDSIANEILLLNLTHKCTDSVFKLCEKLVRGIKEFGTDMVEKNETDAVNIIKDLSNKVINKLHSFDSQPKREKLFKKSENFVEPESKSICTRWEMKENPITKKMVAEQLPSSFQYVPITKTLLTLFDQNNFKDLYMNYNYGTTECGEKVKHKCETNRYIDFCCGQKFKENDLFSTEPNSIQVQLFIDGFNVCDPLKSSSRVHNQVGIYFSVRNLPPELAYNMNNIHLVALCNANDLKQKHTDYNNLWDEIAKDIARLERIGIVIDNNITLKGKIQLFPKE